jgi:transketolase
MASTPSRELDMSSLAAPSESAPEPAQNHIRLLANAIRALSMDAVEAAKSGHPGLPLGMADAATVLFSRFLKFDAADPAWPDRDRFVLSAGHGSMLLYSLLWLTGYPGISLDNIRNFRKVGSPCAGHPEHGHIPGIETTTGPLGQGIANAVGMAIAQEHLRARFGSDLVDHKTYVIASDGDLEEGISHEAISLAGHLKPKGLIVLWDHNNITIDGSTSLSTSTNELKRFEAAGWITDSCDGLNAADVFGALARAQNAPGPVMIACRTVIGFGLPTAGTQKAHSDAPGAEAIAAARKTLNWTYEPFVIPDDLLNQWRAIGIQGRSAREAWEKRKAAHPRRKEFEETHDAVLPASLASGLIALKKKFSDDKPTAGTRKHSEKALDVINDVLAYTIGGSADLTPSNNTKTKNISVMAPGDFSGRYIHYGIREHGMCGAMNGMALHGGVLPYGGTFFVFSDYCRPSIRLAALMGAHVVFVMTHDSIGVGEDGPTHEPIEQLAAMRAMPGLLVMRPCDGVETAECWQIALENKKCPSLIAFSRQDVPTSRTVHTEENLSARGAYELVGDSNAKVTFLSTGSEIGIAVAARDLLAQEGIGARIVSMPCWDLFEEQDEAFRNRLLGPLPRVAIEAGARLGWDRYIGADGGFVGMHSFGASGPWKDVYQHFNITAGAAVEAAKRALRR